MKRSFRFLMLSVLPNLAIVAAFAAVVTVGCAAMGGGYEDSNLFNTYFGLFPVMQMMILFMLSFSLCTVSLNTALSFGARRQDYYLALQGAIALYSLGGWAIQQVMVRLPGLLDFKDVQQWHTMLSLGDQPLWVYPLILLTLTTLGSLCGLLCVRSKLWRVGVTLITVIAGAAAVVMVLVWTNHGGWGDLPAILAAAMAAVFLLSEYFLRRVIRRAVVK